MKSMPRSMDLVRDILFALEENTFPQRVTEKGYPQEQIGYHVHLMAEAGLITAHDTTSRRADYPTALPRGITWAGHDFLEAAREPKRWGKVKEAFQSIGGGMTLDLAKLTLVEMAKEQLFTMIGLPRKGTET
jgi:hypothetical protein